MQVQYLYDIDGKPKFVVIPVELWEKLNYKIDENVVLPENDAPEEKVDIEGLYGIWKDKDIDVEKEIEAMRNEWEERLKEQGL